MTFTRKLIAGSILLCITQAFAVSVAQPTNSDDKRYTHGTCVIVAWQSEKIAVASDSRLIETLASHNGSRELSVGPNSCKVREPSEQVLIAMDGVADMHATRKGEIAWSGLGEANKLFRSQTILTAQQILEKLSLWQESFLARDRVGMVDPHLPDDLLPWLHVLAYTQNGVIVAGARFKRESGKVEPAQPYLVPPDASGSVKVLKYGVCANYLGVNMSRAMFNFQENAKYSSLAAGSESKSNSSQALAQLASEFVALASEVSARLATSTMPAFLAPPIFSAFLDSNTHRWATISAGACRANHL